MCVCVGGGGGGGGVVYTCLCLLLTTVLRYLVIQWMCTWGGGGLRLGVAYIYMLVSTDYSTEVPSHTVDVYVGGGGGGGGG